MKPPLLLLTIFLTSCSSFAWSVPDKVTFHEMNSFDEVEKESAFDVTEKGDIRKISMGVSGASKEAGVVDMIDPDYSFKIGEDSYFLWLDSGVIMDQADTYVLYSLKDKDHTNFKEIINDRSSAE